MDGMYTKQELADWQKEIDKGPRKWEDLGPVEKLVKNDEILLEGMLRYFKGKEASEYQNLMVRLIEAELKEPRL